MSESDSHPVVSPLELHDEELKRYHAVRLLRRLLDPTGETSISWDNKTGDIRKGIRYVNSTVYSFPATGPSEDDFET